MKKLFVFLVLVVLVALFVWPTRYKSYPPGEGPYVAQAAPDTPTRVDRLTGDVAVQDPSGQWRIIGNTRTATAFEQPAVDPNATRTGSTERHNQHVRDQQRHSVEQTQASVDAATRPGGK